MKLLIVPARSGSKRIKDKNVINFYNKPLLVHSLQIAKKSKIFDHIHLSTDSKKYAKIAEKYGFEVKFLRDKSLSDDTTSILDVIKKDCEKFHKLNYKFTDVSMLTATSPLMLPTDLIKMKNIFLKNNRNLPVLSVCQFPANIERALFINKKDYLEYVYKKYILKNSQSFKNTYFDTGNAFYFDFNKLLNFKKSGFSKLIPYILPQHRSVDINEKNDLELCKKLYKIK